MLQKIKFLVFVFLILQISLCAQNLGIGPDTFDPDASAGVEMRFSNKGLLIPRLTLTQRNAISSPATSLLIYQTDNTPGYYYNAGTSSSPNWVRLATTGLDGSGVATRVAFWSGTNTLSSNSNLYWDNTNNRLGIGTTTPQAALNVQSSIANGEIARFSAYNYSGPSVTIGTESAAPGVGYIRLLEASGPNTKVNITALSSQPTYFNAGNVGIGTTTPQYSLDVTGDIRTSGEIIGTLETGSAQLRAISGDVGLLLRNDGTNSWFLLTDYADQYGSWNSLRPFRIDNATGNVALGNAVLYVQHSGNVGIGTTSPSAKLHVVSQASQNIAYFYQTYNNYMYIQDTSATELLYAYKQQLTSKGDGQSTIYGYRTRDSQNDGTGYGHYTSNGAVKGYNYWGDLYSYGVGGFNWNDYNRSGGVLGAQYAGTYWASLGYKNSGGTTYGAYWTSSETGAGYSATGSAMAGVGAGGYGDMLGLWSRGEVMGAIFAGELFSAYNLGNTYTSGTQIELVSNGTKKIPAYSVTSTELKVYDNGFATLNGNETLIYFTDNFINMIDNQRPVVTITPIGKSADLFIKSISKDGFIVACDTPQDIQFTWIAVGTRIDNVESQKVPGELTDINFDKNLVDFMFNENIKERNAKAMWWDGNKIQFGTLPDFFHQADREAKQAELEKIKQMEEKNNNINTKKKLE